MKNQTTLKRLPRWMKSELPRGKNYIRLKYLIEEHKLNTICTSGNCPNRGECWNSGTASFMILGDKCTRNCRFCAVQNLIPEPIDWDEVHKLASTIHTLKLNPKVSIETLIPDFNGRWEDLQKVIDACPEVISHNLETVERLTPSIRSRARYKTSLEVLERIAKSGLVAKTGIMLGLGETKEEVLKTMDDLKAINCKVLTIGQYLQPEGHHLRVKEYIKPETFEMYKNEGLKRGFSFVESSPLVRSSYHAEKHVNA